MCTSYLAKKLTFATPRPMREATGAATGLWLSLVFLDAKEGAPVSTLRPVQCGANVRQATQEHLKVYHRSLTGAWAPPQAGTPQEPWRRSREVLWRDRPTAVSARGLRPAGYAPLPAGPCGGGRRDADHSAVWATLVDSSLVQSHASPGSSPLAPLPWGSGRYAPGRFCRRRSRAFSLSHSRHPRLARRSRDGPVLWSS